MQPIRASWRRLSALLVLPILLVILPSCGAINPLCGSARPAPVLGTVSPSSVTFAQTQQGVLLTLAGSHFVVSSIVIINGTSLTTTINSSLQLQATIPTNLISSPGTATVTVRTPAGTTGDLGCSSGGTSHAVTLTIT